MKTSELLRACADAIDNAEQFGIEPGVSLVCPKGLGRFPMRGELLCVNNAEERVYRVRVTDALSYVSRTLKATRATRAQTAHIQE